MNQSETNAVELLIAQHRAMENLLKKVAAETDDRQRATLFAEAADQLTVHIASEEQIFYPAVNASRTEDDLLESLEEHLSLKRLLADLLALDLSEKTFEPKFKVLKEQAEHHHKEEEEHLFPVVRKMLDASRLTALGDEIATLQRQLSRQPEPREAVVNETATAARLD